MFQPCCLATTIGSLPHTDVALGTHLVFENTPEIPSWVQFPRRVFYENMMVQFTEGMPGLVEDGERVYCPQPCATGTALTDNDSA